MQIQRYNYILLLVTASSLLSLSLASKQSTFCNSEEIFSESNRMATLGGLKESSASNSAEIDSLARFAVEEHNKKENKLLELARVLKVKEQVVAGTLHHLTLEVIDAGEKHLYDAKIWVKPWLNFKELQEFNHVGESNDRTLSDLGLKKVDDDVDDNVSRDEVEGVHGDVQDAANHVIKTLQQRSNSLFPYELQEVVHVRAETVDGSAKYDLLLKVKRSDKEEKFKANVHKDKEGTFM